MTRAAIAADSPITAAAGTRIAKEGGNAVDIAVAAALTATVAEPLMCSLGGSGFLMVRPANSDAVLFDGADAMPTVGEKPLDESSAWRTAELPYGDGVKVMAGHASVAVPGFLAAAEAAWKKYGSLPWRELVQPAVEAARHPAPASPTMAKWLSISAERLFSQQAECRQCFFREGKRPLECSDEFWIPNLDATLEAIAEQGARTLYDGDLATVFASEIQVDGGLITRRDLANYRAKSREPIHVHSVGFDLALNPPPAIGGIAVAYLIKLIEANWRESMSEAEWAYLQAKAQTQVLHARKNNLDVSRLDTPAIAELFEDLSLPGPSGLKSPNTTHFSVVTGDGGMVAVTMSMGYGAGVIVPSLGICCNNSLGEPEVNPDGYHSMPPGTRLVSNMAPSVAWHKDGRCVAIGSPGASRITTSIAQSWARFVLEGKSSVEAIKAPRLHIESFHDELRAQIEPGINDSLLKDEFVVRPFDSQNMYFGAVKVAEIDMTGQVQAFADERRHGAVEIVDE